MRRDEALGNAHALVMRDRNATHGDPEDNFTTIAEYWNVYLRSLGPSSSVLDAKDVAAMMVLMKCSRLATSPEHPDHWVDIAGYAACGCELATTPRTEQGVFPRKEEL